MVPRASVIPEARDIPDDPILGKEKREGFISYWGRVVKAAVFAARDAMAQPQGEPVSKQVARQKKKSRVFAVEDNESQVIDITKLDELK
jgi:hypothetical protein